MDANNAAAPIPDETEIREQFRRALATADGFGFEQLELHDYQRHATAILDIIRPLVSELGTLRARVAELEAELRIGTPWKCEACGKENRRDICVICETDRPDLYEPNVSKTIQQAREELLSIGSQDMPVSGAEVQQAIAAFENALWKENG
jgi:hypothetical protein